MNNDFMNILGILVLPIALMIIAIIYVAAHFGTEIARVVNGNQGQSTRNYTTKEIILKENEG